MSTPPNILLVEDDQDIAEQVLLFFRASGFKMFHIADGAEVVSWVRENQPDAILMDIMLPNQDGVECMRQIRTFSEVPIVMLTAKVTEADRLQGLEVGADDYVCKPFSAAELVMRIKAILRRCVNTHSYQKPIEVNRDELSVKLSGCTLGLTKVEFDVFALLYDAPNRVFSRQQILDHIQPDNFDISDRVIDSHIKNIRKKIKELEHSPKIVESVYGAGYRYNGQQITE
ncbi:response regulator [Pseudoalteromonas sp. McH1-7]|uniref:Two-component system, OmpR family, response regulator BaeR n=1 Tax=Pseudoalteromonas peptidolytica F12-50-A1 TaxID=1315280 RepID=A0A8I0T6Z1_9GAMM|nr:MULTISPECIES: response regulator [Pseudoalteromonas]MBE0348843.1 two-component system, OmpR family, response regulator BaeR [Pseudoalteromonas peptidolytica F12-50-A1]MDW7548701.1 response regulator [Pseudoalteromonas peptidolytica]NLR16296.1 response regulator [Pseudoalteromonas peptidolytica]NUZ10288.1 response regulator [Pseudoalteromonas sp. McH1-7]USD30568.1 response regulator [Pseudoalteromonas sp. SCSIO 43201]